MANLRAYAQMVDEAEKYQCPKNWPTDLYAIDRAYMEWEYSPRTFGWILRENGTHLIFSSNDSATITYWTQNDRGSEMFYLYWYDGDWLRSVSRERMLELTATLPSHEDRKKLQRNDGPGNPNFFWLHNRIEQLHIQEEMRRGRVRDHVDLVVPLRGMPLAADHIMFQFRYIDSLNHYSDALAPRDPIAEKPEFPEYVGWDGKVHGEF